VDAWLPAIISSALSAAVSIAGSWISFRIRFERFQSMDTQRERDWSIWRGQLEERISRIDTREREHERECSARWAKFSEEHGAVKADLRRLNRESGTHE
jgi:hypothetical protein